MVIVYKQQRCNSMLLSGIIWQEFDSSFQRNQSLIIITNHHRLMKICYDLGVAYICNFTLCVKDIWKKDYLDSV